MYTGRFQNSNVDTNNLNSMNLALPILDKSITFADGELIPMKYENILCMDYDMNITLSLKDIKEHYLEPAFNDFDENVKSEISREYLYFILVDRNINTSINIIHELLLLTYW